MSPARKGAAAKPLKLTKQTLRALSHPKLQKPEAVKALGALLESWILCPPSAVESACLTHCADRCATRFRTC